MKASTFLWLSLLAGCDLEEVSCAKRNSAKEDGSALTRESWSEAETEASTTSLSSSALTDQQRQMLLDNLDRRMEKIRRIEGKLEGLRQRYPKANMFAIVQEQLDEIKAQLDAV